MSGSAGLSAAKNRRSGNEVKFNGQSKHLNPPHQQRGPSQQCSQNGGKKQCGVPQQDPPPQHGQQMQPPHPLVLLKSHELRLQKIESIISSEPETDIDFETSNHQDYSTLIKDFVAHKEEYEKFKQSLIFSEKNMSGNKNKQNDTTMQNVISTPNEKDYKVQTEKISNLERDILILHRRIDEMYRIIDTMKTELNNVKEHSEEKLNAYEEKFIAYEEKINAYEEKVNREQQITTSDLNEHTEVDRNDKIIDKVEEPTINLTVIESTATTPL